MPGARSDAPSETRSAELRPFGDETRHAIPLDKSLDRGTFPPASANVLDAASIHLQEPGPVCRSSEEYNYGLAAGSGLEGAITLLAACLLHAVRIIRATAAPGGAFRQRVQRLLTPLGQAPVHAAVQKGDTAHLFAPMGFLDDTWFHRTYWVYGRSFAGGHNGYFQAGKYTPAGRIIVADDSHVYGFARKPQYLKWTTTMEHELFSANKKAADASRKIPRPTRVGFSVERLRPTRNRYRSELTITDYCKRRALPATPSPPGTS